MWDNKIETKTFFAKRISPRVFQFSLSLSLVPYYNFVSKQATFKQNQTYVCPLWKRTWNRKHRSQRVLSISGCRTRFLSWDRCERRAVDNSSCQWNISLSLFLFLSVLFDEFAPSVFAHLGVELLNRPQQGRVNTAEV